MEDLRQQMNYNIMMIFYGLVIGWISMYLGLLVWKTIRQKKGVKDKDYRHLPFTTKLKDSIRHIIFEYNIKRKNHDFLLNIELNEEVVMQIMHRAHFPELCISESDVEFGLALYIPNINWPEDKTRKLSDIFQEESQLLKIK